MISLATSWLKTGPMPRWLVVVNYLVAVALLNHQAPQHYCRAIATVSRSSALMR
jgi:hypothetical protein